MVNSIAKGKSFERDIANYLIEKMGVKYMRVPTSGAFGTLHKTEGCQFKGDVFTEDTNLKDIVIECKSYKEFSLNDLFSHKSKFYEWVEQSKRESNGSPWILFFKVNRVGTYCCVERTNTIAMERIKFPTDDTIINIYNNGYDLLIFKVLK